jgi:small-conductance mechanosensitive channel
MQKAMTIRQTCSHLLSYNLIAKGFTTVLWIVTVTLMNPLLAISGDTETNRQNLQARQLFELSNNELLEQARTIFDEASGKYLVQLRGLSTCNILLQQARRETASLNITQEKPAIPAKHMSAVEVAKIALNHSKIRLDTFKHQLELLEKEKSLLEKKLSQIDAAQLAANHFDNQLDKLSLYLFEIGLRVKDGTLRDDQVPDLLNAKQIKIQRQGLHKQQDALKMKEKASLKEVDITFKRIQKGQKAVIASEAHYFAVKAKYAKALQTIELEQEYSAHAPKKLLEYITSLQEERAWLGRTYHRAQDRFNKSQADVSRMQQELEKLSAPQTEETKIIHAEEAQLIAEVAEKTVVYHDTRIEKLIVLRSKLQSLIKQGESLNADATVLGDHLFKMQVIAKILERFAGESKISLDLIPEGSGSEIIMAAGNSVSAYLSNALAVMQKAKAQMALYDQQIEASKTARKKAEDKAAALKKIYESAGQAQQRQQELKNLTGEQIILMFKRKAEKLKQNLIALQRRHEEFSKSYKDFKKAKQRLESLRDPLLRSARQETLFEKKQIIEKIYKFAGLDLPAEKIRVPTGTNSADADSGQQQNSAQGSAKDDFAPGIEKYQNLLSTRAGISDSQERYRIEQLTLLNSLQKQFKEYQEILSETSKLALQHNAGAVELKKRMGSRQLSDNQIPEGITEALKGDLTDQLETEISDLLNFQIIFRQQINRLGYKSKKYNQGNVVLAEIQSSVNKRVDILRESIKLDQDFKLKRAALTETKLKTLQQKALRRMESEDKTAEILLSFVPSARAKNLSALVQAYYIDLTELEIKQENLKTLKSEVRLLIRLTEEEKSLISKILVIFRKEKEQLIIEKEDEWVKIEAQFRPPKAEEILNNFEAKTGRRLSTPAPVLEKHKVEAIEAATYFVFDLHIQIDTVNKWIELFEQRLSPSGIDADIGEGLDKLGALNATDSTIHRRIQFIAGHSQDEFVNLATDEKSKAEIDKQRFFEGEIGMLRSERYKIRSQEVFRVLFKLVLILLLALLFLRLTNTLMDRYQKSDIEKDPQTKLFLSFLRTILKFAVWMLAIVTALSTLGFNIGTILAGLGIGGLAVAMAAKDSLANILGGIMIFIERAFTLGDIIKIGSLPAAKVVDMTWRTTRLLDTFNYYMNVPNSQVAESSIQNYTKSVPIGDYIDVYISPEHRPEKVLELVNRALADCKTILQEQDKGTIVAGLEVFENMTMMKYWPWWSVDDYHKRFGIRGEVWNCIWKRLSEAGIEMKARPFELQETAGFKDLPDNGKT